ncbi:cation:proton antiporter [Candidatus Woesearchaeota archaeon]|nr:cation:proton antiporter [Candidatus Woesearchaeota archaeon]
MALENIFLQIGVLIIAATVLAILASFLRQPLIIAYVLAGLILGPLTGLITDTQLVTRLSELGIAFLLFLVGLEMDVRKLKSVGLPAAVAGAAQLAITSAMGFALLMFLGFSRTESVYLAVALSFSSTMIVVKLLSDRQELDTLHGRLLVGILLVQDVIAIFALALLSSTGLSVQAAAIAIIKGLALFCAAFLAARLVLPGLFRSIARSQELLFLASVSWCFGFAIFASYLGYSIAIGAFLAGISLASLEYSIEIVSRVKSLRDFFATIFFVSLGVQIPLVSSGLLLKNAILLSAFVLLANPVVVYIILQFLGYDRKVSFISGIGIAQISEFSLILIALGVSMGYLAPELLSLTSIVAIITITLTSYLIRHHSQIYRAMSGLLNALPAISSGAQRMEHIPQEFSPEVILCGQNRIGYSICRKLREMKKRFLVVDHDPDVIDGLIQEGIPCIYGDIGEAEVQAKLKLGQVSMLISTIPDSGSNVMLIKTLKQQNRRAIAIVTSDQAAEALALYAAGADYVIMPHFIGGDHASVLIEKFRDLGEILHTRLSHIRELHARANRKH